MAFFHELKQDTQMALKHYKQAYGHCLEAKLNENLILEVKTLAGFITYKVMDIGTSVNAVFKSLFDFGVFL